MPEFKPIEVSVGQQTPPAVSEVEFNPKPTPRKAKAEAAKKPDQPAPTTTRKD